MILKVNDGGVMLLQSCNVYFPQNAPNETRISYTWGASGAPAAYMVTLAVGEKAFMAYCAEHTDPATDITDLTGLQT